MAATTVTARESAAMKVEVLARLERLEREIQRELFEIRALIKQYWPAGEVR